MSLPSFLFPHSLVEKSVLVPHVCLYVLAVIDANRLLVCLKFDQAGGGGGDQGEGRKAVEEWQQCCMRQLYSRFAVFCSLQDHVHAALHSMQALVATMNPPLPSINHKDKPRLPP